MGWYFGCDSKEQLVRHLLDEHSGQRCLDNDDQGGERITWRRIASHTLIGNALWTDYSYGHDDQTDGRMIVLFLLRKSGNWGYKVISEDMGPCELNCPLRLLDTVPPLEGAAGFYANPWRAKVRAFHAEQGRRRAMFSRGFRIGDTLILREGSKPPSVRLVSTVPHLTGEADGRRYRIPKNYIASVERAP